ncbi:uncharacterized protein EDB91DRAFT_1088293 [Suillus paluster]|uniref:uncharacterized protein n=1 Tax=Suillus paluster TaxID=48578 RepID=UPI001B86B66B|nr:uncharacterized protein EDB91DRAFT_1088293 [Suillus paluster]KAG1721937.1 hypothetical protein EDB91DRAFT_1088293 [Suillus paluster]
MPSTGGIVIKMIPAAPVASKPPRFESLLEEMLQSDDETTEDEVDPDDEGDTHTRMVNMRIRRRLQIAWRGIHQIGSDASELSCTRDDGARMQPTKDDNGQNEEQRSAMETREGRRDAIHQAMAEARGNRNTVWWIIKLARALELEANNITIDCLTFDDRSSKSKQRCIKTEMSNLEDMSHRVMKLGLDILKHSDTGLRRNRYQTGARLRTKYIWELIKLCSKMADSVYIVLQHSVDW